MLAKILDGNGIMKTDIKKKLEKLAFMLNELATHSDFKLASPEQLEHINFVNEFVNAFAAIEPLFGMLSEEEQQGFVDELDKLLTNLTQLRSEMGGVNDING